MKNRISQFKIFAQITKNVENIKWKCIVDECNSIAIKSHLLQKNGILNIVAENGHIFELKQIDFFKWNRHNPPIQMAKVGIRNAFSLPIYCSEHDSSIFKNIETAPVYYENYLTQLLYSYRVVCAEIRKKEINIEKNTRMLNSHLLRGYLDFTGIEAFIEGSKQGIRDLRIYKKLLEEEINEQKEHFVFQVFKYPIIKVYGSAVFSPLDKKVTNPETLDPLNSIFVHVIPTNNQLYIIVGYHKEYSSVWILNYVKSWYQLDEKTLQLKLTNLFAARIENWGINPSLYSKIHQKSIDALINYWTDNALNISSEQETNFNLFA